MKMRIRPLIFSSVLLITVASCGGGSGGGSGGNQQEETTTGGSGGTTGGETEGPNREEGTYTAALSPENPSITNANGSAEIRLTGDLARAEVQVTNALNTRHAQHVHTGSRCPAFPTDDTNADGVIDATEAGAVYGPVFISLDGNIANAGPQTFPSGDTYTYTESADYTAILNAMQVDLLNLEGKVINVHGIPADVTLPATAQGGNASFPISGGVQLVAQQLVAQQRVAQQLVVQLVAQQLVAQQLVAQLVAQLEY
jgi:hypothetical protein